MMAFLVVAALISISFHMLFWKMLGQKGRAFFKSHPRAIAILILVADFGMLVFIGAGNLVGIANLAGGVFLGFYVVIASMLTHDRASVKIKTVKILGIPIWVYPSMVVHNKKTGQVIA